MASLVQKLPFLDAENEYYHVIIETPKGSRNKYVYDEKLQLYKLKNVLPVGAYFPFDFGFLPSTLGEDGDPVDVLLLMDEPAFPGCLVPARLIGVLEVEQTENQNTLRNDRILAVSAYSKIHEALQDIGDLDKRLLDEIEHFFKSYISMKGQELKVIGRHGANRATQLVEEGGTLFEKKAQEKLLGKL